jgi:hypothetical protein
MTTRTELIARLRSYEWDDEKQVTMALNAADMLEADEQGMKDAFASGMSCRPASVQERDKLQEAARLALDALTYQGTMGPTRRQRRAEATTALTETLK